MASSSSGKSINRYGFLENIHLTQEDWSYRWKQNYIGFHLHGVNPSLLKYENKLLQKRCRIFVPLCGKSVDLVYLADKGHDVCGCEFVKKAVKDFFAEQSLDYTFQVENLPSGRVNEFKATSKRITIWQCDLFTLSSVAVGKFDAIWDRASLVAIDPLKRSDYARIMHDLLRKNGRYLISTNEMTGIKYSGPRYSVSQAEMKHFFENFFDITLLETYREEAEAEKVATNHVHINLLQLKTRSDKQQ